MSFTYINKQGIIDTLEKKLQTEIDAHEADITNPHSVTAAQASAVAIANIVDNLITDDATKVLSAKQGKELEDKKVDKIAYEEFDEYIDFPEIGETGKIYVDLDTNTSYRWEGTVYTQINPALALGEDANTAYRGDRGKLAYDHSLVVSGNPHSVTTSEIGAVPTSDIIDNVTTDDGTKVLSAKQGKVIQDQIDVINEHLEDLDEVAFVKTTQADTVTITNTVDETNLWGTIIGSKTVSYLTDGGVIKLVDIGGYSVPSGISSPSIKVYLNDSLAITKAIPVTGTALDDLGYRFNLFLKVEDTGETGKIKLFGDLFLNNNTIEFHNSSQITVDTTSGIKVDVTFTWDDASETRIITSHIRYMELISPRIL